MNKEKCVNCKNYFSWEDVSVVPENGLFVKKIVLNEVCCKVNRDIEKIKRCNGYEEAENKNEEVKEEVKEIKNELVRVEEDGVRVMVEKEEKKDVKKKKGRFVK